MFTNTWLAFTIGLTTGGLSCAALQGGLLSSYIAQYSTRKEEQQSDNASSPLTLTAVLVGLFLLGKLISHTALGILLGSIGTQLPVNSYVQGTLQAIAALFIAGSAANLLQLHPVFRVFSFQPPAWVTKVLRLTKSSTELGTPFLLGFLTILIPCGTTQAMAVSALSSGNAVEGGLIMAAFTLGTFPTFTAIGVLTHTLSGTKKNLFQRVAATALFLLAISSLNGALITLNSPVTLQTISQPIVYFFSDERFSSQQATPTVSVKDGKQQVIIDIENEGYSPDYIVVTKDVPVQLTLKSHEVYTCALSFVLPEFGIKTFLGATDTKQFTFTPTEKGTYTFACSMGMYTGKLVVI